MTIVRSKEQQAEHLAHLLDDAIRLDRSRVRFGLDPLVGLIPLIGDVLVTACGAFILVTARQLGVPLFVLLQMAYNLLLNGLLGTVPIFGDLYSFWYKCHAKNAALLIRAVKQGQEGSCSIESPSLSIVDWALVLALTLPIILLVGYVSFWMWEREISFL